MQERALPKPGRACRLLDRCAARAHASAGAAGATSVSSLRFHPRREEPMPRGGNVKNRGQYEALRRKGMSKQRAAKITNAGKAGSRKGGRKSSKGRKRSRS